mmetsp:Transcript_67222/g.161072  ORF Transcript_67222/g.161072 Transcript_67222/m.161072 type:complete len:240 (-) Transcript_67222:964-1683(-)
MRISTPPVSSKSLPSLPVLQKGGVPNHDRCAEKDPNRVMLLGHEVRHCHTQSQKQHSHDTYYQGRGRQLLQEDKVETDLLSKVVPNLIQRLPQGEDHAKVPPGFPERNETRWLVKWNTICEQANALQLWYVHVLRDLVVQDPDPVNVPKDRLAATNIEPVLMLSAEMPKERIVLHVGWGGARIGEADAELLDAGMGQLHRILRQVRHTLNSFGTTADAYEKGILLFGSKAQDFQRSLTT